MKTLKKLSVILLVISFTTLFLTMSYLFITQNRNEILLNIIEFSILFIISSFAVMFGVMLLEDK